MKQNKCKRITIRFTEDEYGLLFNKYKQTTSRKISDYIRKILLGKLVVVKQRNQSLDELMEVLIFLRKDFNAVARNFNQVVKKLNSINDERLSNTWLPLSQDLQKELISRVTQIQEKINEFSLRWLQK